MKEQATALHAPLSARSFISLKQPLLWILVGGFLLRLLFLLKGAAVYYGVHNMFTYGDTYSYVLSFENLARLGHYTFEPTIPEASFGRLPGFPFFYGIHYLIFGKAQAYFATACSHVVLDSLAIFLVFAATLRLAGKRAALIAGFLYATYPFIIVWVTIMGTELLANFFIVLYFYVLVTQKHRRLYAFWLGMIICAAFFTREYLGIFVPITMVYLLLYRRGFGAALKPALAFTAGFLLLYLPWPIRNYVNHEKIMLVKPVYAGYRNLAPDATEFLHFIDAWSVDNLAWFEEMYKDTPIRFPAGVFKDAADARLADSLVTLGRSCGSGLYFRKTGRILQGTNCDSVVGAGFAYLTREYKKTHGFDYWVSTPLQKLKKGIFKSQLITENDRSSFKALVGSALFIYRTILILLGLAGLVMVWRRAAFFPILAYTVFIYLFICVIFRSVEIRYFLQADVLLLIPAAVAVSAGIEKLTKRRRLQKGVS